MLFLQTVQTKQSVQTIKVQTVQIRTYKLTNWLSGKLCYLKMDKFRANWQSVQTGKLKNLNPNPNSNPYLDPNPTGPGHLFNKKSTDP